MYQFRIRNGTVEAQNSFAPGHDLDKECVFAQKKIIFSSFSHHLCVCSASQAMIVGPVTGARNGSLLSIVFTRPFVALSAKNVNLTYEQPCYVLVALRNDDDDFSMYHPHDNGGRLVSSQPINLFLPSSIGPQVISLDSCVSLLCAPESSSLSSGRFSFCFAQRG